LLDSIQKEGLKLAPETEVVSSKGESSQIEVFKKVWMEVGKVTERVRQLLMEQLKNPRISMELQERNIT
jgi:hypothetical protein